MATTRRLGIAETDAAFVLGRGGSTKRKIARVAGCEIDLDETSCELTLRGDEAACRRAEDYIDFVQQQRSGTVRVDYRRNDLTAYAVPEDCIGFVMGRAGMTLRSLEEEFGVLMFFALCGGSRQELLCIFGPLPARRGAELKVMSAVEHKRPGHCVSSRKQLRELERVPGDYDADWRTDTILIEEDVYSFALGTKGTTRRKLALASGCIVEYVGKLACFCGYPRDRQRARDYFDLLVDLLGDKRQDAVNAARKRDDCTIVMLPRDSMSYVSGYKTEKLRKIEQDTGTYCFSDDDDILILSFSPEARKRAQDLVEASVEEYERRPMKTIHKRKPPPRRPPAEAYSERRSSPPRNDDRRSPSPPPQRRRRNNSSSDEDDN